MKITKFRSLMHPIGERLDLTFSDLCSMLQSTQKHSAIDNGPGWSPTTFAGNKRSKKFAEHCSAVVLDFDEPTESAAQLSSRWEKYVHAVYTTKSNNHDTLQRLRLVLPLSRPIAAGEYPRLWEAIAAHEPQCDPQCKDVSRFWFLPASNHPENATFIVRSSGVVLDPNESFTSPKIENAKIALASAPPGQRNATLNKIAYSLASSGIDATPELAAVARTIGLTHTEIAATLKSASTAPIRDGAFVRGDHAEIAEKIVEAQPNLAHDGLSFLRCENGVWNVMHNDEISAAIVAMAGAPVLSKSGASQLKINQSTITGATAIVVSKVRRDFSKATPGVTFKNCRLTVEYGRIVKTTVQPSDLEKFSLDIDYDDSAYGSRFNELLTNIFEKMYDPRLLRLQEFAGACLFSLATQFQKCLVLLGSGGNGKSQLITAIASAFPMGTASALPSESWGNDFRLAALVGRRLNCVNEMPTREAVGSERFKNVVTGEPLCIDVKYRDPIQVVFRAGHLFAANQLPITTDQSEGFFRRFMIVELTKRFDTAARVEREIGTEVARSERAAVVRWAVHGMARLLAQGGYTPDPVDDLRLAKWATESDSVKLYALELVTDGQALTQARALYRDYHDWARGGGMSPVSEVKFAHRMQAIGFEKRRFAEGVFYSCRRNS